MCRLAAVAAADDEAEDEEAAEAAEAAGAEAAGFGADEETVPLAAAADAYLGAFCFQCGTGFFGASEATPPSSRLTSEAAATLPPAAPIPATIPTTPIPALALRPGAGADAATLASASRAR